MRFFEANGSAYMVMEFVEGAPLTDWIKTRREDDKEYTAATGALLIPVRDATRSLVSLQAVFDPPITVSGEDRDKDFVYGGRKKVQKLAIGNTTWHQAKAA